MHKKVAAVKKETDPDGREAVIREVAEALRVYSKAADGDHKSEVDPEVEQAIICATIRQHGITKREISDALKDEHDQVMELFESFSCAKQPEDCPEFNRRNTYIVAGLIR